MYADPSQIRDVVIRIRLNEAEADLLDAIVKYNGGQKSAWVRDLFMEQAKLVLSGAGDVATADAKSEAPQMALNFPR